jgi:hypothetical protein
MHTIKRMLAVTVVAAAAFVIIAGPVGASTNESNQANHGPYVSVVKITGHGVTLQLVNPNPYYACFEFRTDGDTSQATGSPNFNPAITDGLYPYTCLPSVGSQTVSFRVDRYVEVRSVFGAERDWDFTWTYFGSRRG